MADDVTLLVGAGHTKDDCSCPTKSVADAGGVAADYVRTLQAAYASAGSGSCGRDVEVDTADLLAALACEGLNPRVAHGANQIFVPAHDSCHGLHDVAAHSLEDGRALE